MKKIYVMMAVLLMISLSMFAGNKLYVWGPNKSNFTITSNCKDTIVLNVVDNRIIPEKTKISFTSEQLKDLIFNTVKSSFPNAIILKQDDNNLQNKIQVTISVDAYGAGFGTDIAKMLLMPLSWGGSRWNAICSYTLKIDKNGNEKTFTVSKQDSAANTFGYSSAKKAITNAYMQATQSLLELLMANF